MKDKKIGIVGLGKMGGILVRAFLERGLTEPGMIRATVRHEEHIPRLRQEFGIEVGLDNLELAEWADWLILCVKPRTVIPLIRSIDGVLNPEKVLVSVAASVPTEAIESSVSCSIPVVRAMPNTPCAIGCGMTGLCRGRNADESHMRPAVKLFDAVGRTVVVDEVHFDAVTGLSASGPAFIYIILESLAEAGVKVGLPRDVATLLAAQTAQGAARVVLETGSHPALLKDSVTTPAGCTIDGIMELEEGKLRVTLIKAVVKATQRAKELVSG